MHPVRVSSSKLLGGSRLRHEMLLKLTYEYGDFITSRLGPKRVYIVNDPSLIYEVLVSKADSFHKTPTFKRATEPIIGQGLLTSEDELHRRQRKLVQPAFHAQRIAGYADIMVNKTASMLDAWQDGCEMDIHREMMRLTLLIVSEALFGADVTADADRVGDLITMGLHDVTEQVNRFRWLPRWIPIPKSREAKANIAELNAIVQRFIDERRVSGNADARTDLLSMILTSVDEAGAMSDAQARSEVMTLFIAGHETTANLLAWTFLLLAENPHAAAILHEEIDCVLAGRRPSMDDLPELRYTEMVIKESMRLYPPAWIVPREVFKTVDIGGCVMKQGSFVITSPYLMHRHRRYFPEPEIFDPQRFSEENEKALPKFAYFPFGGGPRICIGNMFAMMEAKLCLATIAQRWRLELLPDQQIIPEPVITLRPKDGIEMSAHERAPVKRLHLLEDGLTL